MRSSPLGSQVIRSVWVQVLLVIVVGSFVSLYACQTTAYPVNRRFELKRRLMQALAGESYVGNFVLRNYSSREPGVWTTVTTQGMPMGTFVNRSLGPGDRYLANPAYVGVDIRTLPGDAVLFIASFDDGPMVPVLTASDVSLLLVTPPQ